MFIIKMLALNKASQNLTAQSLTALKNLTSPALKHLTAQNLNRQTNLTSPIPMRQ